MGNNKLSLSHCFYTTSPEMSQTDYYCSPVEAINDLIATMRARKIHYHIDFHVLEHNVGGRCNRIMGHWFIDSDTHTATRLNN